ncbi:hypothetical protein N7462_000604 [Penicillium macrosclerotiorum]|uniref:uncharacterized protein n=1 Tax=Penicillium macrosclerotiorum TaxID=303699 RepID=UPI002547CDD0|nr:uncharacterized protein N7462_000604 [Penicillium macrosclerotiorum]KAJ5698599.1 hypothetical protein N7462_000604 [Penicillium macrosclerotiorum]
MPGVIHFFDTKLARVVNIYSNFQDSVKIYHDFDSRWQSLNALAHAVSKQLKSCSPDEEQTLKVKSSLKNCATTLKNLSKILDQYPSLETQNPKYQDKVKFAREDIQYWSLCLKSSKSELNSAQRILERKLGKYPAKEAKHQGEDGDDLRQKPKRQAEHPKPLARLKLIPQKV